MLNSVAARNLQEKMQRCSDRKFTGLVEIGVQNVVWLLYFVSGSIVWLESDRHPLRRWERQLSIYNSAFYKHINQPASTSYKAWNYGALAELVKAGRFPYESLFNMAEAVIAEDLFDLLQASIQYSHSTGTTPTYWAKAKDICHLPKDLMYHHRAWQKAQTAWTEWEQAGLAKISPDWVLVVSDVDELRSRTSPQTFETLSRFMDGTNTLRDLAVKFKQPLITLTNAVLPYTKQQLLSFAELPNLTENFEHAFCPTLFANDLEIDLLSRDRANKDLTSRNRTDRDRTDKNRTDRDYINRDRAHSVRIHEPLSVNSVVKTSNYQASTSQQGGLSPESSAPKIVYIDDSPIDNRLMSAVVEGLGYRYTNISNPIHALPMLLEIKPDFIFLDLVMPIANGYEVCSQIRRISAFKKIPIVIVTSNDGIGDRVRAKFVGASGFIGKPIQPQKVSKVLKKFLRSIDGRASSTHPESDRSDSYTRLNKPKSRQTSEVLSHSQLGIRS